MKKKVLIILSICMLCFSLSACGVDGKCDKCGATVEMKNGLKERCAKCVLEEYGSAWQFFND
jgi:hypothetical protein